jgi:hypothetical protein
MHQLIRLSQSLGLSEILVAEETAEVWQDMVVEVVVGILSVLIPAHVSQWPQAAANLRVYRTFAS